VRVQFSELLGCQIWQGATTPRGYPVIKVAGRTRLARRVVYEQTRRPLQPGEIVEMSCGERRCLEPSHMVARRR
jgi:hypothetical protein